MGIQTKVFLQPDKRTMEAISNIDFTLQSLCRPRIRPYTQQTAKIRLAEQVLKEIRYCAFLS